MVISRCMSNIQSLFQYLDTCLKRRALFRKLCTASVRSNQHECQWKSAQTSLSSYPHCRDALTQHKYPLVPRTRHKCSLLSHTDSITHTGITWESGNRLPVEAPQIWSLRFLECICTLWSQGNTLTVESDHAIIHCSLVQSVVLMLSWEMQLAIGIHGCRHRGCSKGLSHSLQETRAFWCLWRSWNQSPGTSPGSKLIKA